MLQPLRSEPDDEAGRERVIARAEREVPEGGRRGTGTRPALTVPCHSEKGCIGTATPPEEEVMR